MKLEIELSPEQERDLRSALNPDESMLQAAKTAITDLPAVRRALRESDEQIEASIPIDPYCEKDILLTLLLKLSDGNYIAMTTGNDIAEFKEQIEATGIELDGALIWFHNADGLATSEQHPDTTGEALIRLFKRAKH